MSEPDTDTEEIAEEIAEEQPENDLVDPDDYHRRQRLKEIHQRRAQVHKAIDGMDFFTSDEEHGKNKTKLNMVITSYISELEPLIRQTDESPELPEQLPWDSVSEYADMTGSYHTENNKTQPAGYQANMAVFRACNQYLGEVKPLIEEDDTDEWEV